MSLLQFDYDKIGCDTIDIINAKNGVDGDLELPKTPTLNAHIPFLNELLIVEGVTSHGQLFQAQEEINEEDDEELEDRI